MNESDEDVTPPLRDMGRGLAPQKATNTASAVTNDDTANKGDTISINNNHILPYFKNFNSNTTNPKHHTIISAKRIKQVNNQDTGVQSTRVYITQSDKYIPPQLRGKYANGTSVSDADIDDDDEAMATYRASEGLDQRQDAGLHDVRKTHVPSNAQSNGSYYHNNTFPKTLDDMENARVTRSQRYADETITWKNNKAGRRWHNDPLTILGEKLHKCSGGAGGPSKSANTDGTQVGSTTSTPTINKPIRTRMSMNQTSAAQRDPYMPGPKYIPPHARAEAYNQTMGGAAHRYNNEREKQAQVADLRPAIAQTTQHTPKEQHHALRYEHLGGMDKRKTSKNYMADKKSVGTLDGDTKIYSILKNREQKNTSNIRKKRKGGTNRAERKNRQNGDLQDTRYNQKPGTRHRLH